jgi:hypothetical protein
MGGIRAVVASIEEEEAAEPPIPASAPPTVIPPPASVGPAGDKTTSAPSAPPIEETVQPKTVDSTVINDLVVDFPIDSLSVVTAEPELVTDVIAKEIPPVHPTHGERRRSASAGRQRSPPGRRVSTTPRR